MSSKFLVPLVSEGQASPFFLIPSAGATPFSFIKLARSLTGDNPVYSFELPGMADDIANYDDIQSIACAYLQEILTVQPEGPYYLGGHCAGANIALAIAIELEEQGKEVAALILMEAIMPTPNASNTVSSEEAESLNEAMQLTFGHMSSQLSVLPEELAELLKNACVQLIDMASQYDGAPVKAPLIHFRTETHANSVYAGWHNIQTSGIEEHVIPGDAFSMLASPIVESLAVKLAKTLR